MEAVKINIVTPDGRAFIAEVNPQAEYQSLLQAIVEKLKLPNPTEKYELLLNALKLDNDVTIRVSERGAQALPRNIRLVE